MKKIKLVMLLTLLLSSSNLFAAGVGTGKINFLAVNDFAQVQVETSIQNGNAVKPECSTDNDRFVADLNTEQGKAMFSILLAAQAQGLNVIIGGKNNCNVRDGVETIQYVTIRPQL